LYCLCAQDNLGVKKNVLAPRKTLKYADYVFHPHKKTSRRIRISGALKAKLGNHGQITPSAAVDRRSVSISTASSMGVKGVP
jgi:hypothetical protein